MEWNEFKESEREFPEIVVKRTIDGFEKATKGLAELVIVEVNDYFGSSESLGVEYSYAVQLVSPYMMGYQFIVCKFGYNVTLFPVKVRLEEEIGRELSKARGIGLGIIVISTEAELEEIQRSAFGTKRFKEVVAGLMKISAKKKDMDGARVRMGDDH